MMKFTLDWSSTSVCLDREMAIEGGLIIFLHSSLRSLEQPALFKVPEEDGGGALFMHVDDVLFLLDEKYLLHKFMSHSRDFQGS